MLAVSRALGFDDASAIGGAWAALGLRFLLAVCSYLERERGVVLIVMATVAGLAIKSVHEPALGGVSSVRLGDVVRVELVQVEVDPRSPLPSAAACDLCSIRMLGAQAGPWLSDAVLPALISVGNIGVIQVGHVAEASESSASQSAARYWHWTSGSCVTVE